ncbi:MAG: outer membrane beta-barrel protein [Flavobacteriales bacterium]|nr:outer membrane beta-barrel protein [Flavobacteriales bacterium]
MYIRSTVFIALLAIGATTRAQYSGIGIKGGIQATTAHAILVRTVPITGVTAGLYAPWGIAPKVEIQPEISVSTMGTGWIEPDGDAYTERSLYIHAPVTFKYFITNGFNLAAGFQFGKPLSARVTGSEGDLDVTDRYENLDMGFVGGVGMGFQHGVDLSLRLYSATTRFHGDDDALFAKNRSVQFTIGYRFVQFRRSYTRRRP